MFAGEFAAIRDLIILPRNIMKCLQIAVEHIVESMSFIKTAIMTKFRLYDVIGFMGSVDTSRADTHWGS